MCSCLVGESGLTLSEVLGRKGNKTDQRPSKSTAGAMDGYSAGLQLRRCSSATHPIVATARQQRWRLYHEGFLPAFESSKRQAGDFVPTCGRDAITPGFPTLTPILPFTFLQYTAIAVWFFPPQRCILTAWLEANHPACLLKYCRRVGKAPRHEEELD